MYNRRSAIAAISDILPIPNAIAANKIISIQISLASIRAKGAGSKANDTTRATMVLKPIMSVIKNPYRAVLLASEMLLRSLTKIT